MYLLISKLFRLLPSFKGKYRLGSIILKPILNKIESLEFTGKNNITYTIPNTIEQVGKELFINGVFEKDTIQLIKKFLKTDDVFFDVGANIGSITLPIAKNAAVEVHSFEPSKLSFSYLSKNVRSNHLEKVNLNHVAVHSQDGINLTFYEAEDKYGNSSLSATSSGQTNYLVPTVSIDAYCKRKNISKINVLKIDVQGYEIEVLKGAAALLNTKSIDIIIFEMEAWAEKQAGYEVGASQLYLLEKGYQLFNMHKIKIIVPITIGSAMFLALADTSLLNFKKR